MSSFPTSRFIYDSNGCSLQTFLPHLGNIPDPGADFHPFKIIISNTVLVEIDFSIFIKRLDESVIFKIRINKFTVKDGCSLPNVMLPEK